MDLAKVLTQLRAELENLNVAIASLERLASQGRTAGLEAPEEPKRPGRPRKNASTVPAGLTMKRGGK